MTKVRSVAMAALLLAPGAARAHAILMESTPPAGGNVAAGHESMVLRYNSKVDSKRSVLTLVSPDGKDARLPVSAGAAGDVLTTTAELTPGAYTLRWQVLAIDGHLTRGDVPFTVTAP